MATESEMATLAQLAYYERQQMLSAVARLAMLQKEREEAVEDSLKWEERLDDWQVETNAFLESFLVHYRNLLEFLAPTGGTLDETVTAADFLGWSHRKKLDAPSSYRKSIHKRLSHISRERLNIPEEEKSWPVGKMALAMEEGWSSFIEKLREENQKRVSWFSSTEEDKPTQPAQTSFTDLQSVSAVTTASTQAVVVSGPFSLGVPDWVLSDPIHEEPEE